MDTFSRVFDFSFSSPKIDPLVRWGCPGQGCGRSPWFCRHQCPRDGPGGGCHSGGAAGIKVTGESPLQPWVHRGAGQGWAWQGQSLEQVRGCPAFTWWQYGDCVRKNPSGLAAIPRKLSPLGCLHSSNAPEAPVWSRATGRHRVTPAVEELG